MNLYQFATQPSPMKDRFWQAFTCTTQEQFDMIHNTETLVEMKGVTEDSDLFRTYCLFVWWATQPE